MRFHVRTDKKTAICPSERKEPSKELQLALLSCILRFSITAQPCPHKDIWEMQVLLVIEKSCNRQL